MIYHKSTKDGGCLGPTLHLLHGKYHHNLITLSWHFWKPWSLEVAGFLVLWRFYFRISLRPWKFIFDVCGWWTIYRETIKFYDATAGYGFDRISYRKHLEQELKNLDHLESTEKGLSYRAIY